jgi:hypothetical protein
VDWFRIGDNIGAIQTTSTPYPLMLALAPHSVCSVRNPVTPGLKMKVMTSSAGPPTM